ncbi:MAG: ROK family protein [Streptococcaceae bacterium]|nr:ROK family protein [Streptococcaceae bacterium]MCH4177642.1 ROK family protein [Streptococcaceae bacterium]
MLNLKYNKDQKTDILVLETIINQYETNRASLSQLTGLNKATISVITKKLLEDELIKEVGIGNASNLGGRKPILLKFNGMCATSITIDFGYNYYNAFLYYLDGREIASIKKKNILINQHNVVPIFKEIITIFENKKITTKHGIIGIAIAIHGPVNNNQILFTPSYDLEEIELFNEFSKVTNYPIYLENEANLAALGEYTFSSEYNRLVAINMHSGIGAGIVDKGILQYGTRGMCGEIGHQIISIDGRRCNCGNLGCLETYASNKVIFKEFADLKNLSLVNAVIIREFFNSGDLETIDLIKKNAKYVATGINNVIVLFDPELIIINSSLYREIPELFTYLKQNIKSTLANDIKIEHSKLNEYANLLGGLSLILQKSFKIHQFKIQDINYKI